MRQIDILENHFKKVFKDYPNITIGIHPSNYRISISIFDFSKEDQPLAFRFNVWTNDIDSKGWYRVTIYYWREDNCHTSDWEQLGENRTNEKFINTIKYFANQLKPASDE